MKGIKKSSHLLNGLGPECWEDGQPPGGWGWATNCERLSDEDALKISIEWTY